MQHILLKIKEYRLRWSLLSSHTKTNRAKWKKAKLDLRRKQLSCTFVYQTTLCSTCNSCITRLIDIMRSLALIFLVFVCLLLSHLLVSFISTKRQVYINENCSWLNWANIAQKRYFTKCHWCSMQKVECIAIASKRKKARNRSFVSRDRIAFIVHGGRSRLRRAIRLTNPLGHFHLISIANW